MSTSRKTIAIVGGGAAGLCCASFIDSEKYDVTIYERNKSVGRKFLVAGKGGFNLTHAESIDKMITRFNPQEFLADALRSFDNVSVRAWLDKIGIPTYVGSSNRVYPVKGIKPIAVLNAITDALITKGIKVHYGACWSGWQDDGSLVFDDDVLVQADVVIFALGGGSWKITGSDGGWLRQFEAAGYQVKPFAPANCGVMVDWSQTILDHHEGKPLKYVGVSCGGKSMIGDVTITNSGLEGSPIYALSEEISAELEHSDSPTILVDLKPELTLDEISNRLLRSDAKMSVRLEKKLRLDRLSVALLKANTDRDTYTHVHRLAAAIKRLPISVHALEALDKAISTRGGLARTAVDKNFRLDAAHNKYAIGEMLDWNAPTGGYLLQGCFSMGYFLASHLNRQF